MVTDNHYRWDFIGLSTDEKPTPETSFKVVNGSTFYCSDNSKLYVWYSNQWYEKTASGVIPTTVIDNIWFGTQAEYNLISPKSEKTLYLVKEDSATLSVNQTRNLKGSITLPQPEIIDPLAENKEPEEPEESEELEEPEESVKE